MAIVAVTINAGGGGGAATYMLNDLLAVCNIESVTVTVYVAVLLVTVGVPNICPVVVMKVNPLGNPTSIE